MHQLPARLLPTAPLARLPPSTAGRGCAAQGLPEAGREGHSRVDVGHKIGTGSPTSPAHNRGFEEQAARMPLAAAAPMQLSTKESMQRSAKAQPREHALCSSSTHLSALLHPAT